MSCLSTEATLAESGNKPYSLTQHLAESIWLGQFGWRKRMAFYSGYFDESGHPDDSEYVTVAGCIADVEQWKHFEREWLLALAPLGTRLFHTTEFHKRKAPYATLTDGQATDLLRKLVGIICRRIEKSVSQTVMMSAYRKLNERFLFAECYGFPYPANARRCMSMVVEWGETHGIPAREVLLFFEDGAKHKGQIEWIAERDRLRTPIFLKKEDAVALQAGDLLAWLATSYLNNGKKLDPMYERALEQLSKVSHDWGVMKLEDPVRITTMLGIPRRDPAMQYKCKLFRKDGRRRAIVRYWPKCVGKEPKLDKKRLIVSDPPILSTAYVEMAMASLDSAGDID